LTGRVEGRDLTQGVHAGVGASRSAHSNRLAKQLGQCGLQPGLNRVFARALELPAAISGTVVLKDEPDPHKRRDI